MNVSLFAFGFDSHRSHPPPHILPWIAFPIFPLLWSFVFFFFQICCLNFFFSPSFQIYWLPSACKHCSKALGLWRYKASWSSSCPIFMVRFKSSPISKHFLASPVYKSLSWGKQRCSIRLTWDLIIRLGRPTFTNIKTGKIDVYLICCGNSEKGSNFTYHWQQGKERMVHLHIWYLWFTSLNVHVFNKDLALLSFCWYNFFLVI